MKAKTHIVLVLIMLACLTVEVQAVEHNFPAGSFIIPMDKYYQADGSGALEAYGLVYSLLAHQDQTELADCARNYSGGSTELANCQALATHDITVYWVIDQDKTTIDGPDLIIEDSDLEDSEVVKLFNRTAGGSPTKIQFDHSTPNKDSDTKVTYRGGLWVVDINDLTRNPDPDLDDLKVVEDIIRSSDWSAVNVHVAQVPFKAEIFRRMKGKPPRIALMNSEEDTEKGNADILESYLRLAGICPDVYDVLTPNQIGGVGDETTKHVTSALFNDDDTLKYDFVWAPHWTGEDKWDGDVNDDGERDVDEIILKVQQYLKAGGALLAECASIETFEYNKNGYFLTTHGFAHNGGTNDEDKVVYNNVTMPYAQIGDFGGFEPEGGHLHNWRPFQLGDEGDFNFDTPPTENSSYRNTVTRFTVDDGDEDGVDDQDWDYYVGGYAYGNRNNGYVVYLGGHKYAKCGDDKGEIETESNVHPVKFEFKKDISDEVFELKIKYDGGELIIEDLDPDVDFGTRKDGVALEVDFTEAEVDGKKFEEIKFRNLTASDLEIEKIELKWANGHDDQKIKKTIDEETDTKHLDDDTEQTLKLDIKEDFTIAPSAGSSAGTGCTQNHSCEYTNLAGVRYILNTLFDIKYQRGHSMFTRAAPVVSHPYLYQGYFAYESHPQPWVTEDLVGHFRRFDMTQAVPASGVPVWDWDTASKDANGTPLIPLAATDNSDGRRVYTAEKDANANFTKLEFDTGSIDDLRVPLDLTPDETGTDKDDDEKQLINKVRGKRWNYTITPGEYVDDPNRLGPIMHSAPVIVRSSAKDNRYSSRPEVAYVGDLDGMLHAIETETGKEIWAYIPSNLLDKLKNDRSDSLEYEDFPAVDGSPTARNIYYDLDYNPVAVPPEVSDPSWRTVLVCPQGFGGKTIFALDITDPDPDEWKVLWEKTVADPTPNTPGGGMGHAFRASLDKIKVRVQVRDLNGDPIPGEYIDTVEWRVFIATSFDAGVGETGGINVFSLDLRTGDVKWTFSAPYTGSINDIPGAVTTHDLDDDTFADRIYVGDMSGRLWALDANDPDPGVSGDPSRCIYKTSGGVNLPLFSAGSDNPISVSPAITRHNGHVILVFGTGGAHFADLDGYYNVYYVDATAAGRLSQTTIDENYSNFGAAIAPLYTHALPQGQKVWSSPTIAAGQIWIATASGTMESKDPANDMAGEGQLQVLDMNFNSLLKNGAPISIKKVRGSLYVSREHVYAAAIDGSIIQFGDGDFPDFDGNRVLLKTWEDR